MSEIKPDKFFNFLKPIFKKGLTEENWNSAKQLEDLLILGDKQGKKMVNLVQQNSAIYNNNPNPYRTYTLTGIKQISEVKIKTDILKKYSK